MRRTRLLASVLCLLWIGLASAGAAENQKDKAAAGSSRHGKAAKVSHAGRAIALLDVTALFKADLEFSKADGGDQGRHGAGGDRHEERGREAQGR